MFLFEEVANRLLERLSLVRKELPVVLDLGCGDGFLSSELRKRNGTHLVISADTSYALLGQNINTGGVVADAEMLPFQEASLDAAISCLDMHWVNDLPGALLQIRRSLKPDGVFLAAILGGATLVELRQSFLEAELKVTGGVSPRVSPFADLQDIGALMQRAGFALPVVDDDKIEVEYSSPINLMQDLRGMAATNATLNRPRQFLRRDVLMEAMKFYQENYSSGAGKVRATFEVIYMIGWAPHQSQQKPLMPGSARHRLADALQGQELPAGEKTRPF